MVIILRATRVEIIEFWYVMDINILVSNVFLGLKNMKFEAIPLTKVHQFYII